MKESDPGMTPVSRRSTCIDRQWRAQSIFEAVRGNMMINGLKQLSMLVSSEKSVAFYEAIGFQVSSRKARGAETIVTLEGFRIKLLLNINPKELSYVKFVEKEYDDEPRKFVLFVDGIEETMERIKKVARRKELQIEFSEVTTDSEGSKFVSLRDPDGLAIELHE